MRACARWLLAVLFLAAGWTTGCSGAFRQVSFDATELHRTRTFNAAQFKDGRVAVLIATGMPQIAYRRMLSDTMVDAWKGMAKEVQVLPPFETLNLINREGLSEEYGRMIREYESSGILSKAGLGRLGHALKVRYIIMPTLVEFTQQRLNRVSFFGVRLVDTQESSLRQSVQVWDAQTGEILWEGTAVALIAGEKVSERSIGFEEIAARLADKVTRQLLGIAPDKKSDTRPQQSAGP